MNLSNYKRIFMISDTHLGVHNNSIEWMNIIKDYFNNFFIPLLKKEKKEGDILVHLGDVFDSRQSLNLLIINESLSIFEEISNIMPIVIILGNHDVYHKNSNEVNSVKILKWIPNIKIYEEPEFLTMSGRKILLMPWKSNYEEEMEYFSQQQADYLFCHTDIQGLKFNKKTEITEGITLNSIKHFKKIFSGHIHYSQKKGNLRMLGCPYSLTRSDVDNNKGIWLFDLETEEEKFFLNDYSPRFIRLSFEKMLEMEEEDVKSLFYNNFVDIITDQKWTLNFPFSAFYDNINGFRKLEFIPKISFEENNEEVEDTENIEDIGKIDIIELANKLIQNTPHPDNIKEKLYNTIKKLYQNVQKSEIEFEN